MAEISNRTRIVAVKLARLKRLEIKTVGRLAAFAALAAVSLTATPAATQSYTPSMRYPNPDGDMNTVRGRGPCNDPWITIAQELVYGRADPALCAPALYRGGSWGSFNDLVHAVAATRAATGGTATLRILPVQGAGFSMIGVFQGGSLVAAGGGNLVAAGGGNIVAAGGGNIAPVATVQGAYSLQSGRSIRLPSGGIGF